jgi:hypothetical protein
MYSIENEQIVFRVDEYGCPFEFTNKDGGENYLRRHDFWRLIVQDEQCLEIEVKPDNTLAQITVQDGTMTIRYTDIKERFSGKILDMELTVILELDGDQLTTGISISNNQAGAIVKEVHFPLLAIREESIKGVVTTYTGGQYFKDVRSKILKAHTQFKGLDHYYIRDVNCYPTNAMNCMLVDRGHEGLYIGCHDDEFKLTAHILELDHNRDFNMVMGRFPYLTAGQTCEFDRYIISPYLGEWRVAADKYRSWADSWYQVPERPRAIMESNGWQRLIMRTQYGRDLYTYDGLQSAFEDAQSAGIDSLFLFGWHTHGMDNGYPDYAFDEGQGGFDAFKKGIRSIQDQGGKIILYFNGQLIDRKSQYFEEVGQRISSKLPTGDSELHCYSFPGPGITAAKFGNRTFTTACPSSTEWLDMLKSFIDVAIDLEVDSVFFDQIGNMGYPCCDPEHGHPIPYTGIAQARMHQLTELRSYLKKQRPNMGFGVEWLSDVTAQHTDFVHIWGNISECDPATLIENQKPHSIAFQEFFHYAFPEVVFSDREIRTDQDIERRVNIMLLKGCCSDVEIYRCQTSIAEAPHYQKYLTLANAFRDKFKGILTDGKFLADARQNNFGSQNFSSAAWEDGNTLAVMVTQSHLTEASDTLSIPGYRLIEHDSVLGDATVCDNGQTCEIVLPRHSLAILTFERSISV